MHLKNIIRHLLLVIFSMTALQPNQLLAMGGMSAMPGQGQGPSLEDIRAMEAEIDNFVKSLPPEQQKQFYKDVEELTGIMEKMSPDELNEFVGSVFTDAGLMEPTPAAPAPKPEAKPEPRKEEVKPAVVITTAPSGPTEKAVTMITAIINRTEEFMRKAQIIPELQVKMDKWVVQKKLLEVTAKLDWETVAIQIDELNIMLYALREKDHVTNQYKHIGNLIKDEALYNNLATLQVTLEAYVPLIYAPDFGLEKVSKESRAAIREVLSQYLESFYLLNVPNAIKKVVALYAPRAKELSEEEKKAAEQARKEAEKTRRQAPGEKSPLAKSPYPAPTYPSSYDTGGYGYTPSYTPSSYDYAAPTPSYAPSGKPSMPSGAGKAEGAKEGGKGVKEGGKEGGGENKENEKPGAGAGGTKDGKPAAAKEEMKKNSTLDRKLFGLTYDINKESEALFKDDVFKDFVKHFTKDKKDFDETFIDANVSDLIKKIDNANTQLKAYTDKIKKFKTDELKSLNKTTQEEYKKDLINDLESTVKSYKSLSNGIQEIIRLEANHNEASQTYPHKYYIYFDEDKLAPDPENATRTKVLELKPKTTMKQLKETIDAFVKEVGTAEAKK